MPILLDGQVGVGIFLFSQAVTSQLSSALLSLTSVFGMGTGGPSASSTPTLFGRFPYYIFITQSVLNIHIKFNFEWCEKNFFDSHSHYFSLSTA